MSCLFLLFSVIILISSTAALLQRYSLNDFRRALWNSQRVVMSTGAGVSVESGIPTYRDDNGLWRKKIAHNFFTTANRFQTDPASIWEYYHYRRELVMNKKPNAAHIAIAKCQKWFQDIGRQFTLITTNVDGLHQKAGAIDVLEVHGSLFQTKCTKCKRIEDNFDSPICEALRGKENLFNETFSKSNISINDLPHCKKCGGLLRPNVIWFNEMLPKQVTNKVYKSLDLTDLFILVGSSQKIYPAAAYGHHVVHRGVPVAEFNIRKGPYTNSFRYYFKGNATHIVPAALDPHWKEKDERMSWEKEISDMRRERYISFSKSIIDATYSKPDSDDIDSAGRTSATSSSDCDPAKFNIYDSKDYTNKLKEMSPSIKFDDPTPSSSDGRDWFLKRRH